jgi:hypothetical protein
MKAVTEFLHEQPAGLRPNRTFGDSRTEENSSILGPAPSP